MAAAACNGGRGRQQRSIKVQYNECKQHSASRVACTARRREGSTGGVRRLSVERAGIGSRVGARFALAVWADHVHTPRCILPPASLHHNTEVGGWRLRMEVGGWRLEVGGWRLEAVGWCGVRTDHDGGSGTPVASSSIGTGGGRCSRQVAAAASVSVSVGKPKVYTASLLHIKQPVSVCRFRRGCGGCGGRGGRARQRRRGRRAYVQTFFFLSWWVVVGGGGWWW